MAGSFVSRRALALVPLMMLAALIFWRVWPLGRKIWRYRRSLGSLSRPPQLCLQSGQRQRTRDRSAAAGRTVGRRVAANTRHHSSDATNSDYSDGRRLSARGIPQSTAGVCRRCRVPCRSPGRRRACSVRVKARVFGPGRKLRSHRAYPGSLLASDPRGRIRLNWDWNCECPNVNCQRGPSPSHHGFRL